MVIQINHFLLFNISFWARSAALLTVARGGGRKEGGTERDRGRRREGQREEMHHGRNSEDEEGNAENELMMARDKEWGDEEDRSE